MIETDVTSTYVRTYLRMYIQIHNFVRTYLFTTCIQCVNTYVCIMYLIMHLSMCTPLPPLGTDGAIVGDLTATFAPPRGILHISTVLLK